MILTPTELQTLTNRKRAAWQARELKHLGIPFRRRSDGSIVVLSADLGQAQITGRSKSEPQVRFS